MVCKFFGKKSKGTTTHRGAQIISEDQLIANELYRPITRGSQRRKLYSCYRDGIWSGDLADTLLISKCNKSLLLSIVGIYTKYPLKDKKIITITNSFQKISNEFGRQPNKI